MCAKLFRQEAKFVAGAAQINQIPELRLPEIAFIGRSNVGKSSLINTICNNARLARVSNTPGRTKQINFFIIGNVLTLVDLPGYGFAQAAVKTKLSWQKLIDYYLQNSVNLKLVNVLIDSRRGIDHSDEKVIESLINYNRDFQIIFTKVDKICNVQELLTSSKNFIATLFGECNLLCISNKSKEGAKEVQHSFAKFIQ